MAELPALALFEDGIIAALPALALFDNDEFFCFLLNNAGQTICLGLRL
jgi:hypothetical protein